MKNETNSPVIIAKTIPPKRDIQVGIFKESDTPQTPHLNYITPPKAFQIDLLALNKSSKV